MVRPVTTRPNTALAPKRGNFGRPAKPRIAIVAIVYVPWVTICNIANTKPKTGLLLGMLGGAPMNPCDSAASWSDSDGSIAPHHPLCASLPPMEFSCAPANTYTSLHYYNYVALEKIFHVVFFYTICLRRLTHFS